MESSTGAVKFVVFSSTFSSWASTALGVGVSVVGEGSVVTAGEYGDDSSCAVVSSLLSTISGVSVVDISNKASRGAIITYQYDINNVCK